MKGVLFPAGVLSLDVDADFLCNDLARVDESDGVIDSAVILRLCSLPTWVAVDLIEVLEPIDDVLWRADRGTIEKSDSSSGPTSRNSSSGRDSWLNIERRGDKSESRGDDPETIPIAG